MRDSGWPTEQRVSCPLARGVAVGCARVRREGSRPARDASARVGRCPGPIAIRVVGSRGSG